MMTKVFCTGFEHGILDGGGGLLSSSFLPVAPHLGGMHGDAPSVCAYMKRMFNAWDEGRITASDDGHTYVEVFNP